jgi:UDP-N-acetylmuramoyl-L-alanyl-D-glutamate--2,6-diaminopimelate ligase
VQNSNLDGSKIFILENNIKKTQIKTKLVGNFNYENILAAYIIAINEGLEEDEINSSISSFDPVDGRFNVIKKFGKTIIIDFAHSPDALMNSIKAAKSFTNGKLIVVFGAGGHADALKRPIMGEVASENADIVIVTNDNPYYENEYLIITQILHGISEGNIHIIPNRYMAIKKAIELQKDEDLVLICGKGHERFIIYDDRLIPFYDKEVVEKILNDFYGK